jgi:hypothetical protein
MNFHRKSGRGGNRRFLAHRSHPFMSSRCLALDITVSRNNIMHLTGGGTPMTAVSAAL